MLKLQKSLIVILSAVTLTLTPFAKRSASATAFAWPCKRAYYGGYTVKSYFYNYTSTYVIFGIKVEAKTAYTGILSANTYSPYISVSPIINNSSRVYIRENHPGGGDSGWVNVMSVGELQTCPY